jgi:hypothetical protein
MALSNEPPRLRSRRLGLRKIRLVEGLRCPNCGKEVGNYPEETGDGWRLLCRCCHAEIVVTEDDANDDWAEDDECV